MKTPESSEKKPTVEPSETVRALGLCAIILCLIPIIVLVPIAINPINTLDAYASFYEPKFWVLMMLSAPLLVAVLGAVVADRKRLMVPMLIPALAFFGVSVLSTHFAEEPTQSLVGDRYDGLLTLAADILLFYATARFLDSWARVRTFLVAGVTVGVLVSVYGILQQFELDPIANLGIPWFTGERVPSTLAQPVHLAAYLTLMMGAALALYLQAEGRWTRGIWLVALALMGACWLYTYTRGAMLGVVLALPVVLFLAHRFLGSVRPLRAPIAVLAVAMLAAQLSSPRSMGVLDRLGSLGLFSPYTIGTVLGVVVVAVALFLAYRRVGSMRPLLLPIAVLAVVMLGVAVYLTGSFGSPDSSSQEVPEEAPEGGGDPSVQTRLWMWRDTVPMILDRPLLGHGPDNYAESFSGYEGPDLRQYLTGNRLRLDKAHNEFFQVAATTGFLGLAAYLWIYVAYFRNVYRRRGGWILLALSGGVLAYILQLQTAFTTIATGVTFWALLGVSVAVMRLQDQGRQLPGEDDASAGSASAGSAPE